MVEESEERLTDEQVQSILDIVSRHFPQAHNTSQENDDKDDEEPE